MMAPKTSALVKEISDGRLMEGTVSLGGTGAGFQSCATQVSANGQEKKKPRTASEAYPKFGRISVNERTILNAV